MFNFLHNYIPDPIFLNLGVVKIHWYGFLMVVGGLLALWIVIRLARQEKIKADQIVDLAFYWLVFSVIGARLYYVLYAWEYYRENLWDIVKVWEGGLAIHGILIGGFLAVLYFVQKNKLNFWRLADLIVPGLALAQAIGRVGNYFNQEIFGKPTDLPWGIPIEALYRPAQYLNNEYFHPTFLYESLGNLIIFGILITLTCLKIKGKVNWPAGVLFGGYLILYSIQRFCLEFLRIDYSPVIFGVRWAMVFSGLIIVGSLILIIVRFRKQK